MSEHAEPSHCSLTKSFWQTTTVWQITCIGLFFQKITELDAGLPETLIEKKSWEKNVFVDVCLPACLFIHLFIYYLEVAL